MSRSAPRSRREIVIILLLLVSVGLVLLDRRAQLASRIRQLSNHVFVPSQSWLRGFTLSLVGPGADGADRETAAEPSVAELRAQRDKAESDNAVLWIKVIELEDQLREIRQIVGKLPSYPLMLVPANVLSPQYVLPDAELKIDAGSSRGVGKGHYVLYEYISQGKTAGVRPGQPVLTGRGLVGIVEEAGPNYSRIRLVTNPECRLAAQIMHWDPAASGWIRQGEGQIQGAGDGRTVRMLHVPRSMAVAPGDYVVTATTRSGMAEYLIVGEVIEVSYLPTDLVYDIVVRPRVRLDRLDTVYVLSPRGSPPD